MFEFSARTRERALDRMTSAPLDLLVIGGGATGCGVALDAASRGLAVGLVERDDFASGTSGRSSRLIHGGIRYLSQGDVGLVYESLRERERLRRLAPHLVQSLAFFTPSFNLPHRAWLRTGFLLYDGLAAGRNIARHKRVDAREAHRLAPGLAKPRPGMVSFDGRTDDARLTLENARAAAHAGAAVANHAGVEGIEPGADEIAVTLRDGIGGAMLEARARVVVNATGIWAQELQSMTGASSVRLRPSKGVHLVFRSEDLPLRAGVVIPSGAKDRRFVFVIPYGPRVYAGTTDTPYEGALEDPDVDGDDEAYLLAGINRAFGTRLTGADATARWAGLRPLLEAKGERTRDLSRRHVIVEDPPGVFTVTGGKLTTYRQMAEDVTDRVCMRLGVRAACRTTEIPLGLTRPIVPALGRAAAEAERLGLSPDDGRRLVYRFGDEWEEAIARIVSDRSRGEPLVPGLPVLRVEADLARDREMALSDDDVLVRRTRLATMDAAAVAALTL